MVVLDQHEWCMVIDGLMSWRLGKLAACGVDESVWNNPGEDPETERLMWRVMLHGGLPNAQKIVPEAYALCFPNGPPTISGTYGKFTHKHDDE